MRPIQLDYSPVDTHNIRRTAPENTPSAERAPFLKEEVVDLFILKTWMQAKFTNDERGASMVEYGLLLALIAVIAIVAVRALGGSVSTKFSEVDSSITN